ncbi:DUF3040 domain-containing protein [Arthrobacter sp. LAR12-1-1.1]|uniref:DUF3040 domain-containing protein n=1 Tax=Arthrobacter sp. LAR12-1-1.1 TaxID=3135215 RepID=UPI00342ED9F1
MSHSPLSEHEKSLLEQLEKQFKEDHPTFAKAMEEVPAPNRSALHIVAGAVTVVAGFLLLLLGAALQGPVPNILVGVLGFAVMIVGAFLAMRHTSVAKNRAPAPTFQKPESVERTKAGKDRRPFRDAFGDWALWGLFWWV